MRPIVKTMRRHWCDCVRDESDEGLSKSAAAGDRDAFAMLLKRHYDRIFRLAYRISGKRQEAEEIAQDVCVKLAKAIQGFRAEAKFSTWLHRIVYTTALDHLRHHQRTLTVEPSEIVRLVEGGGDNFSFGESAAEPDGLWEAVNGLPNQQRDALLLVYGEELSHREAGEIMGCSEKTVSWHVHQAKKRLKILLEATG